MGINLDVYNKRNILCLSVMNIQLVRCVREFSGKSHNQTILKFHANMSFAILVQTYPAQVEGTKALPEGSFLTASGDDTIRVWNLDPHMESTSNYKRNIFSNVRWHSLLQEDVVF